MAVTENRTVTSEEARVALLQCFYKKRPVFLWGPPGIGKSELVESITKEMATDGKPSAMIDLRLGQMDPTDIRGIPFYNKDLGLMDWAPPIDLPSEEFAARHSVVVLFFDEMNSAAPSVQAAAYQLILNRRVGKYKLPDNVVMVAAGNREGDKGVTFKMPSPLANRFVHLEMRPDYDAWLKWATVNGIHKDVVGYISFAKQDLFDFDPKTSSRSFATPRAWTFVSELISEGALPTNIETDLVAGTVGEGTAVKFMAHRKVAGQMPNPRDVLEGKVKELKIKEISAMYSLTISMCYELKDLKTKETDANKWHEYADNFFKFMMENFTTEVTVMGARVALTTYNLPFVPNKLKTFDEFHKRFGKYIVSAVA